MNQLRVFRSPDAPDYVATEACQNAAAVEPKPGAFGAPAKHLDVCKIHQPYWRAS